MSFTEQILWVLQDLGEFTTAMLTHRLKIGRMPGSNYYTTLRRLEKKHLIKKKKSGRTMVIAITAAGRKLLKKPSMGKRREDGLSTIIIFDIPEEQSKSRQALRRYLLRHGYTLIQESVLVSSRFVTPELRELIREFNIATNVKIISGKIEHS